MDTRKIVLSLTAMIGFCSLSVQAQTNNTGRVQDTVKQSIDTLINKVGSDVKQAAKTTVDKVGTDVNTVKSGAQRGRKQLVKQRLMLVLRKSKRALIKQSRPFRTPMVRVKPK